MMSSPLVCSSSQSKNNNLKFLIHINLLSVHLLLVSFQSICWKINSSSNKNQRKRKKKLKKNWQLIKMKKYLKGLMKRNCLMKKGIPLIINKFNSTARFTKSSLAVTNSVLMTYKHCKKPAKIFKSLNLMKKMTLKILSLFKTIILTKSHIWNHLG